MYNVWQTFTVYCSSFIESVKRLQVILVHLRCYETFYPLEVVYHSLNITLCTTNVSGSNIKANHLCCTYKQLAEKTDGKNKHPNWQFWKDNKLWIPHTSDHPGMKWLKTAWKKCRKSYGQRHAATWRKLKTKWSSNQNLVELANVVGLEDITEDEAEELLQSHGKSLTKEELQELAVQCIQREFTVRELSTEFLSNSIITIMQITNQFIGNVPDIQWSSKATQGVFEMISYYQDWVTWESSRKDDQLLTPTPWQAKVHRRPTTPVPELVYNYGWWLSIKNAQYVDHCMLNKRSLYCYICTYCTDFHKKISINIQHCYIFICIFTYPH